MKDKFEKKYDGGYIKLVGAATQGCPYRCIYDRI